MKFLDLLNDVLLEKDKSLKDLEKDGIICERTFYRYNNFTPYLPAILKICNYLNISLDYLAGRTDENKFKTYNLKPTNFYNKLMKILNENEISQSKLSKDLHISRPNFTYWKKVNCQNFKP